MAGAPRAPRTSRSSSSPQRPPRTAPARSAPPTLADDAAHAGAFTKHPHKEWYTEWWYFNVRDPKTGIALLAMYEATPFGLGTGAFASMVFRDGAAPFDATDLYPHSQVSTSSTRPDVQIGPNRVEALDADTYHIVAASRDGRIAWDLTLERVPGAEPAWLLDDARGPLDWEVGYWMTWLPLARARGTITVDGVAHAVEDASAYHDHNWGVWASPLRNWQWMQCSSAKDGVALDLGYSDGFDPPRAALLDLDGRTLRFDYSGIDLPTYVGFRDWEGTPWKYPQGASTTLIDPEGRVRVEVEWKARRDATLPLYTTIVLFEQHVDVTLRVSERAGDGSWQPPRIFTLDGIAEWSDSYLAEWSTGEGLIGGYVAEATVFGGGVTGLTAAHELAERGFAVTVVEREEALDEQGVRGMAVGGMARSHYARVPRLGQAPANRPAGRPTPDARDDRWTKRSVVFGMGSDVVPSEAEELIASAARAFRDTYCDQGYRMRVVGAASPVEAEPRALAARRAQAVRDRLIHDGVAADLVVLAENAAGGRPEAVISLEDHVLPGEHGFRFFPAYYRHVTDTMGRIPVYDREGRQTERRVLDNLKPTPEQLMLKSGQRPSPAPAGTSTPLQLLRLALGTLKDQDYDPRDYVQLGLRISRYLATCPERREPLEDMSWWNYLCGFSPRTRCYLYRYSNAFTRDSTASGRVLAAFDWQYGDARTNGSTYVQLFEPLPPGSGERFDGTLDAPTSEAWFVHWRRYLGERGVRFVSGSLERLAVETVDGQEVVIPWVKRPGAKEAQPWATRTRAPHYVVVATDAPTAEAVSKALPRVGVPAGLSGYTTSYDGRPRDPYTQPGLGKNDRFQTLSGVQYFFDQNFAIGGHGYSLDAPWSLSTLSMQRAWSRIPFVQRDGFAGLLSVDIGDFRVPAGPTQQTAWDSTRERIGEQVWMQLSNDLRTAPLGPSPLRLPRPTWFHIDDNLEFGDRDGKKGVVVRNGSPYLVPITSDWERRPGPMPFDPAVPDAPVAKSPPQKGVWSAPHGGYPVHWGSLVYAGIYLKTFTRMTTMESANESGRHAVNAVLDHYNAHHGSSVAPPSPPPDGHPDPGSLEADEVPDAFIGDYCQIWNIERYENPSFDSLKAVDQVLYDLGLPHLFDLLGIELLPSVLSHVLPYRGDCSLTGEAPPRPVPEPAPWCPPFVGNVVSRVAAKAGRLFGRQPRPKPGTSASTTARGSGSP